MGGNNGIGLGNNMPPIVNYPGVGNVGTVGGVALVSVQQAPSRAVDVVGQLDVLLLKACAPGSW